MQCPLQQHATMSVQLAHECHWRDDQTCSYCGSISPDVFFEAISQGCTLGPTDKNYKVYVDLIEPNPQELRVFSAATFDISPERQEKEGWIAADPAILARDGWSTNYKWMQIAPRGPVKHAKFYFQHLNDEERKRFVELMNARVLTIGAPGYFYRLPFFVTS